MRAQCNIGALAALMVLRAALPPYCYLGAGQMVALLAEVEDVYISRFTVATRQQDKTTSVSWTRSQGIRILAVRISLDGWNSVHGS